MRFKELLSIDLWASAAYGIGQALLFALWIVVAVSIIQSYNIYFTTKSVMIAAIIGSTGAYWYGVRKYEATLR